MWRYYSARPGGWPSACTRRFAIRDPQVALFEPLLSLARENSTGSTGRRAVVRIAGVCGPTRQAVAGPRCSATRLLGRPASLARGDADEDALVATAGPSQVIPRRFLPPAGRGRTPLAYSFWRRFAEIDNVVAIKVAAFNRYQTLDVVRAIAESGRDDIALYTGNDDNIVADLLTPYCFAHAGRMVTRRFVGGLLGHWAVWTRRAVELLRTCHDLVASGDSIPAEMLRRNAEVTDMNAVLFDVANGFAGCIPGVHEVLRRQGLLEGTWCLDPHETLSPGQGEELDRISRFIPT